MEISSQQLAELLLGIARAQAALVHGLESEMAGIRHLATERAEQHAHRQIGERRIRMVAQVRHVLQRRDDAAAAYAGHLVLESLDHCRLGARDAEKQFSELLGRDFHGEPPAVAP